MSGKAFGSWVQISLKTGKSGIMDVPKLRKVKWVGFCAGHPRSPSAIKTHDLCIIYPHSFQGLRRVFYSHCDEGCFYDDSIMSWSVM